jgi:hypothetical protein
VSGTAIDHAELEVVSPAGSVDLSHVRLRETRQRDVVVRNRGGTSLVVTPDLIEGGNAGLALFLPSREPMPALAPLESTTITVALTPNRGGPITGQLELKGHEEGSDREPSRTVIDLEGYGDAPDVVVEPGDLDFGSLVQGWQADARRVTIRNGGTSELLVTGIELELGSSTQIQLAGVPPLPLKLTPDDRPLEISVFVVAGALGPVTGNVLVSTNGVTESVRRVAVRARVVTCDEGCPTANGRADCSAGRCEIGACFSGFHDSDKRPDSGCECREDLDSNNQPRDISGACPGVDVGPLGDACAGAPNEVIREGSLQSLDDVDLYFFESWDDTGFFCDTFGDSYHIKVELLEAPPGVELCARRVQENNGCGGENQRTCGLRVFEFDGGYGRTDSSDTTIWIRFAPGANPVCGNYKVKFRARD